MRPKDLIFYTLSHRSGMGRFASELVAGAGRASDGLVTFIAPAMEHEPNGVNRVVLPGLTQRHNRIIKLFSMFWMTLASIFVVLVTARKGSVFVMVDLYTTIPFSVIPALAARLRGASAVLNMHDFYPHASRYAPAFDGVERALYRWCYRRFDLIAVMNASQVGRLVNEAGVAATAITVIRHGPFTLAPIADCSDNTLPPRFLVLGALRRNKCIREVLEAVALLGAEGHPVQLRLAGAPRSEEKAYWATCRSLAARMPNVEICEGYIQEEDLAVTLSGVAAMICAYEGFDSQSGVSIVAVSNGIPLIASGSALVKGCEDFIFPIAEPVSSRNIADAMLGFLQLQPGQRWSTARAAKERFLAQDIWCESVATIIEASGRSKESLTTGGQ